MRWGKWNCEPHQSYEEGRKEGEGGRGWNERSRPSNYLSQSPSQWLNYWFNCCQFITFTMNSIRIVNVQQKVALSWIRIYGETNHFKRQYFMRAQKIYLCNKTFSTIVKIPLRFFLLLWWLNKNWIKWYLRTYSHTEWCDIKLFICLLFDFSQHLLSKIRLSELNFIKTISKRLNQWMLPLFWP